MNRNHFRVAPRLVALECRTTPATLTGTIYQDANFNNDFEVGEKLLSGATVTLTVNGTVSTRITDASGTYSFGSVPAGTHKLAASVPGYSTTNLASIGVNVASANETIVTDFGFAQKAVLRGFVFTDLNNNNVLDALERVVSNVKVNLDLGNNGSTDIITETDANGVFRFAGIGNGTHKITLDSAVSTIPGSRTVTVSNSNDIASISFAVVPVGTLEGSVFDDKNANGIQDGGETALAGVSVKLDFYGDGSIDQTVTTAADGKYAFTAIPDGTHLFSASRTGYSNTTPNNINGSFSLGNYLPPPAALALPPMTIPRPGSDPVRIGPDVPTLFGLAASRILGGYVYADANRNGGPDDYEGQMSGVSVGLDLDNNGSIDRTATTDDYGRFAFTGIAAGTHKVVITAPAGFKTNAGVTSKSITLNNDSLNNGFPLQAFSVAVSTTDPAVNQVKLFNDAGMAVKTITPFATASETRIASADINGDGVPDYAFGTGPGVSASVRVVNGLSGQEMFVTQPFGTDFRGGVLVALGDLNGDGKADLVMSPDVTGGPRVRVFDVAMNVQIADFFGIDDVNFRGGARAAIGDLNADGKGDLIVAAGTGGGPRLALYDGSQLASTGGPKFIGDFFAFEPELRNGSFLTAGDINGDGYDDLVAGAGTGGSPRITVFSGKDIVNNVQTRLADFFAGNVSTDRTGVRLGITDLDADGKADIIAGYRPVNTLIPRLAVYSGKGVLGAANPVAAFDVEPFPGNLAGIYVG